MKVEEVIEFLKTQDLETITSIWMEIMDEVRERWDKTKEKPADIKVLEEMMKSPTAIPGFIGEIHGSSKGKIQPVIPAPIFGPYITSQAEFGFPPTEEKLTWGKVYIQKDYGEDKIIEGGISCGGKGLTVITNKKAISLKYQDVEKIEWQKGVKKNASTQGHKDSS